MSVPAIEISQLTKVYGNRSILQGFDLRVGQGQIFGFLGPNGAGKTTTLRILLGLARPTSGSARVLGHDVATDTDQVRAQIGFVPDVPGFYPWMNARQFLTFAGGLFGLGGQVLQERVQSLLDLASLQGVDQKIGGYSRGMKQRLGIAQALINAPQVLMLDEPTSALDPIGRKDVLDMVSQLRGRTTVFFSTHILTDVERVCDHVAILGAGRVLANAPIDELKSRHGTGQRVLVTPVGTPGDVAAFAQTLLSEPWVVGLSPVPDGVEVQVTDMDAAQVRLPRLVADAGLGLGRLETREISLEDVFIDLVEGRPPVQAGVPDQWAPPQVTGPARALQDRPAGQRQEER